MSNTVPASIPSACSDTVVIVPLRRFADGKSRLAPVLDPEGRRNLSRNCAEGVLTALSGLRAVVVCDDDEVADWAGEFGADVVRVTAQGLNASLTEALPRVVDLADPTHLVVCHGDLPVADGLADVIGESVTSDVVTIVGDTVGDGTNVLIGPTEILGRIGFHYGPGSAERHRSLVEGAGGRCRVISHPNLSLDVDLPSDLERPEIAPLLARLTSPKGTR